jgi:hypothetical protein
MDKIAQIGCIASAIQDLAQLLNTINYENTVEPITDEQVKAAYIKIFKVHMIETEKERRNRK